MTYCNPVLGTALRTFRKSILLRNSAVEMSNSSCVVVITISAALDAAVVVVVVVTIVVVVALRYGQTILKECFCSCKMHLVASGQHIAWCDNAHGDT